MNDRAWLDAQYNVRAGIDDYLSVFSRFSRVSAPVRARRDAVLEVFYGDNALQSVDVFPARESTGADPVLVFLHGGYWQSLDKSMFAFLAQSYIERGVCFAAVNYRLAPAVGMDEIVADVRDAIGLVHDKAADFGADPNRLYVAGHSAGGHLTARMLATRWAELGRPADLIKGGCAISGLYDLDPIQRCYLNDVVGMDEATAQRHSPVHAEPAVPTPLILSVGGDESAEFHRQQREFAAAWRGRGHDCRVVDQPDGHHFRAVERLSEQGDPLFEATLGMVRDE
ncbi:alpha/beta hydrolase [Sciscionella sediminilitoris]|uniref:alpha/beta hydrolase n=1 Tax=Sciscionella sediminilitoris TaxID=1445613 RepID=UPI0004DFA598|nr:alpha/beta hydrolase [Sciscionella sp. SE31]